MFYEKRARVCTTASLLMPYHCWMRIHTGAPASCGVESRDSRFDGRVGSKTYTSVRHKVLKNSKMRTFCKQVLQAATAHLQSHLMTDEFTHPRGIDVQQYGHRNIHTLWIERKRG